jgi:hypothetical protein
MRTHTHQKWDLQGNLVSSQVVAWTAEDYAEAIKIIEEDIAARRLIESDEWLEAKELELATLREEMP